MILPIVKHERFGDAACAVPCKLTYSFEAASPAAALGADAFGAFSKASPCAKGGFVRFAPDSTLEEKDEIYRVTVTADGMTVGFRDARGAVNGAATAALLLRQGELKQGEIVDYPSCGYRSLMIDMARGLPRMEDVETTIYYMALAKYNRLHLHLIDSEGPCYVSEALPEYRFTGKGGQCDKATLRRLAELCRRFAIEIVPEIEVPAHATAIALAHPEFKCPVENADGWAICPGNDDVWSFFEKLVGEVSELFPDSEYLHIGTDELEFLDFKPQLYCHWSECPRCAALREREHLHDKRAEFYYVIDRMHDIVRAHGKKMMMWNDQIDVSGQVPISRDIVIEFWRVACKGRGPHAGCSMEGFLQKGFKVINADYPNTYFDIESYLTTEKIKTWTPYTAPAQSPQYADQVLGGEACAWEFGNGAEYPFYGYVTPLVAAVFADKLWALGTREHDESYRRALAELVFGSAAHTDVFDLVGSILPPRKKNKFTYVEPDALSEEALAACSERLQGATLCPAKESYVTLLAKIAETKN